MSFFANLSGVPPEPRLSQAQREAVDEGGSGAVVVNRLWLVDYGHAQKDLGTTAGSGGEAGSAVTHGQCSCKSHGISVCITNLVTSLLVQGDHRF